MQAACSATVFAHSDAHLGRLLVALTDCAAIEIVLEIDVIGGR